MSCSPCKAFLDSLQQEFIIADEINFDESRSPIDRIRYTHSPTIQDLYRAVIA